MWGWIYFQPLQYLPQRHIESCFQRKFSLIPGALNSSFLPWNLLSRQDGWSVVVHSAAIADEPERSVLANRNLFTSITACRVFSELFENAWLLSTITIWNSNLRNCLITWITLLMAYQNHDDWKDYKIMGREQCCPHIVLQMLFP